MDSSSPKRKWQPSLFEWLVILAIVAMLARLLWPPHGRWRRTDVRREVTQVDVATLADGLNQHRLKFGAYPSGGLSGMLAALMENSDRTNSPERSFRSFNERREPVDLWSTPYRIETNPTNGLSIRSAGPNRRFGDADDLGQSL